MTRHASTIVVGAGSAGSVIARRLSERSDGDVLLLEAGPDYPPSEDHDGAWPGDIQDAHRNSMFRHDWGLRHKPHPDVSAYPFPRGRVVGGSSAVNTAIALRGQPYDFDEWQLPEWTWDQCLPAFCRLETDLDFGDRPYHGSDGPIPIRRYERDELSPWQSAFYDACASLGFEACEDSNEPGKVGYGSHAKNEIEGVRMNVARCYLTTEVRGRDNFALEAGVTVRRVLFEGRRAIGVEVERSGGVVETIHADRVVLCAGAIHTPGILVRSGVGPRADIERLGVELVSDVPAVGHALLDHPGAAVFLLPNAPGISRDDVAVIQTVLRFQSSRGRDADLQMQPGSFIPLLGVELPLVSMMVQVGKPRGRGHIRFDSVKPDARPWIDSRLLADPDDMNAALEAMDLVWLLVTDPALRDLARLFMPTERGFGSKAAMRAWILNQTGSGYHPCGTVPMASPVRRDPIGRAGATDSYGRVHGTEGLIVADASLFPTVQSSNINLPTIMLGERFGEWLRDGVI